LLPFIPRAATCRAEGALVGRRATRKTQRNFEDEDENDDEEEDEGLDGAFSRRVLQVMGWRSLLAPHKHAVETTARA